MRLRTPRLPADSTETRVNLAALAGPAGTLAVVTVPVPPSTNHLFATVGRRRIVTRDYKAWQAVAIPILERLARPVEYPCEVWMTLRGKANGNRDIANIEKAITDAMVKAGVLPDDKLRYVVGNHQLYRPDDGEPRVEVRIESLA